MADVELVAQVTIMTRLGPTSAMHFMLRCDAAVNFCGLEDCRSNAVRGGRMAVNVLAVVYLVTAGYGSGPQED